MAEEKKDFNIFTGFKAFRQSLPGYSTRQFVQSERRKKRQNRPHRKAIRKWRESRNKPIRGAVGNLRKWRTGRRAGEEAPAGGSHPREPLAIPKARKLNKGGLVRHKSIYDMDKGG